MRYTGSAPIEGYHRQREVPIMDWGTCSVSGGTPVAPPFSGPFVGVSPKIQTRIYRTWPVVHTTPTAKDDNNDALDRHRAPLPLTAKQAMGH